MPGPGCRSPAGRSRSSTSTPTATEADAILDLPPPPRPPTCRSASPATTSTASSSASPRRPASPRNTRPRSRPPPASRLVLNANLVDLRLDDALAAVTGAVFRSYAPADPGFTVQARAYALCTGGIENARLLLNFTSQVPEGIGNRSGRVGRCFADHPHFLIAEVLLRVLVREREFYSPTEPFMAEHACLNFGLRLEPRWIGPRICPPSPARSRPRSSRSSSTSWSATPLTAA